MDIDVIIPLYFTYDLLNEQIKRWRTIEGNWRLLICDNTPATFRQQITVPEDLVGRIQVYHLENRGIDGEKHGAVVDFMIRQTSSDLICIHDCDFFWLDKGILTHAERFFKNGYVCIGAELHYNGFDYVNDMYPERRGCFVPCVFGMFLTRELALSETFVVTAHEGCNERRETGWRIREKIQRENLKTYVFPAIQHPEQATSKVKNINLPWFYIADHKFAGVHTVGSTSYNKDNQVELLKELYRIAGITPVQTTIPMIPLQVSTPKIPQVPHVPQVLILGGCGYIGTSLSEHMCTSTNVTIVDTLTYGNSLKNFSIIQKDYSDLDQDFLNKFDVVILCSAHSSVRLCTDDPFGSSVNNIFKFINFVSLLEKLRKPPVFIYMSSSSVYGDCKDQNVG